MCTRLSPGAFPSPLLLKTNLGQVLLLSPFNKEIEDKGEEVACPGSPLKPRQSDFSGSCLAMVILLHQHPVSDHTDNSMEESVPGNEHPNGWQGAWVLI